MKMEGRKDGISSLMSFFGVFGIFLVLSFVSAFIYSPVFKTSAVDVLPDETEDVDVTININPVLSLSLDTSEVMIDTSINSFETGLVNASVITNSAYGYTLTLEGANDWSALVLNGSGSDYIPSDFIGAKTSEQMPETSWGFSSNGNEFYAVPEHGYPVWVDYTFTRPISTRVTPVTFGVKTGVVPSGIYTNTVLFSAFANGTDEEQNVHEPGTLPSLQTFRYENDCLNMQDGEYKSLKDSRDGQWYGFRRIDNICWMTKDLNLNVADTLDGTNTNIYMDNTFTINYVSSPSEFANIASPNNKAYMTSSNGYYTWYTATGGGSTRLDYYINTTTKSICPSGWELPYANNFTAAVEHLGSVQDFRDAIDIGNYSGYINTNGEIVNNENGNYVQYWTRKGYRNNDALAVAAAFSNSNGVSISARDESVNYGLRVRCVLHPVVSI